MDIFKKLRGSVRKFFIGYNRFGGFSWNWHSPKEWGKEKVLHQYRRYVYPIISAIAEEAAKVEYIVERTTLNGDIPVSNHPVLQLLKKPNPQMSQFQFLELHFTFMKLAGESYWYLAKGENSGKIKELYLLRPDLVEVIVAKEDNPRALPTGYVMHGLDGQNIPFGVEEIIHHKMPNPLNPYYGYGTLEASQVYVETEFLTSHWTRNSLYNSGRPSGIINVKGPMDVDEYRQLKAQFKQEYSGTENAGKTLILKGLDDITFNKLGMELDGTALSDLKNMTRDDIMLMFRVSKTMLGISEGVTVSNAQENRIMFIENLIRPELDRLTDSLNAFLMPFYGSEFKLSYVDPAQQSESQRLNMYTQAHNKWMTTNEIREELGYPPLVGGDVLYQPIMNVPVTGTKSKNIEKKQTKDIRKKTREERASIFKEFFFDTQEMWIKKYYDFMIKEYNQQKKEIIEKNTGTKANVFEGWKFDIEASDQRIVGTLVPMGLQLFKDASKYALEMADAGMDEIEISEAIIQYIKDRIERLSQATNDETIKKIEETIAIGYKEGESVEKLVARIVDVYGDSIMRAERIARTESLAVSNEAALEAYKQSPMTNAKEWSAEFGACEFCQELDGKIIGLSENFASLGEQMIGADGNTYNVDYEDIARPPAHPNCRCALLPVAETKYLEYQLRKGAETYLEMDKRKKEAKKLYTKLHDMLETIRKEAEKVATDKKQLQKEMAELEQLL